MVIFPEDGKKNSGNTCCLYYNAGVVLPGGTITIFPYNNSFGACLQIIVNFLPLPFMKQGDDCPKLV
jgi:hypothetical protein